MECRTVLPVQFAIIHSPGIAAPVSHRNDCWMTLVTPSSVRAIADANGIDGFIVTLI
jgi:hypothetical protein